MKNIVKFTTVALAENQHLRRVKTFYDTAHVCYMFGYKDGKREKALDGFYYRKDLKTKKQ